MKTSVPDSLGPGLTDKQLESLYLLMDGNWHDHAEISRKTRTFIPANISGRIVRPLEDRGIIEQEERSVKEGSKKVKKFVRIRKDVDEHTLHLLIEYSANDLVMKCRKESAELANSFLEIRNESIKKLCELEKLEEECRQRSKEEFWKNRESSIPYSESWPKLIAAAKAIADRFENALKPLDGLPSRSHQLTFEKIIENIPSTSFLAACDANPDLWRKALDESQQYEDAHLSDEDRAERLKRAAILAHKAHEEFEAAEGEREAVRQTLQAGPLSIQEISERLDWSAGKVRRRAHDIGVVWAPGARGRKIMLPDLSRSPGGLLPDASDH